MKSNEWILSRAADSGVDSLVEDGDHMVVLAKSFVKTFVSVLDDHISHHSENENETQALRLGASLAIEVFCTMSALAADAQPAREGIPYEEHLLEICQRHAFWMPMVATENARRFVEEAK